MYILDDFPVSVYYKKSVKDAYSIRRGGTWWSAILLIEEPRSKLLFINFYKWQHTESGWKTRSRFKISNKEDVGKIVKIINEFAEHMKK